MLSFLQGVFRDLCEALNVPHPLRPARQGRVRTWLENAHQALDRAVFAAYGWPAEEDGKPLGTQSILSRLLALNHQRRHPESLNPSAARDRAKCNRLKILRRRSGPQHLVVQI